MRLKKKKLLGIILSLVLVLGLVPGMRLTAHAAESKNIGTDVVYVAGDTIVLPDGGSYFKFDRYSNVEQKSGNSTVNTITNQYGDDYNIETSGDWSSYFNLSGYDYSESSQGLVVIGIKFSGSGTSEDPYIPLLAFGELDAVWEGDGEGTESSPYLINNVNELKTLADNVKRGMLYGGKYFRLTSDINCGEENWEPIGGTNQFRGTFDGDGNTVTYHITDNSENGSKGSGLFYGIAVSGTVKNLKVSGSIVGTSRYGNYYAGIAGINRGTIINCSSNVNITSPGCDIAGIAGSNKGTISYCAASGSITWNGGSNSYAYVAGMTGVNDNGGTVTNCTSLCDISAVNANGYSYASRVIGRNFGTVQNCYYLSSATITGDYVGTNNATEKTTDELKEIGDAAYNAGYNVYGLALGYMLAPTIKTQPEAKTLTYNGQAQELVTAGTVEGGTMQYALGTKDAATEEYTESIPTATGAGTYYVWYKVVGDDNLNNSEAEKVTVTISQLSIKNATVSLDKTDLVYTGSEQSVQVSSVKIGETVLKANSDYEVSGTTGTNKGDYTVTVTGKGNYKDVVTSKWNIAMATPVIDVLPSASAITYGQSLADSTLTEGTAKLGENVVEGTFSWKNDATKPVVSDSEKTEYVVVFTPNDADNLNTVECKVKVTVNKAIAGVAKAPTANTLIYNGKAQVLVKAGEATDGIMNYAIGKDDKTAPAEGWNTSIPTATGAGTYYVWYKVVGDSNHLDSDAGYVTVTIAPADSSDSGSGSTSSGSTDSGSGDSSGDSSDNTNTDTDTSAKVPYEDVAISTGSVKDITGTAAATAEINPFGTKIENNSNLTTLLSLTDAEVAQGVNVWLDVQDMSASVPQTDKTLIQNTSGDYTVGLYLDINLFKKVGSNDATKVTETKGKVKASIVIPESLWKSGRTFEIIRVHDGVATAIAGTYDENTHVFTFETDKFSTYALAYKDPASSSNSGTTSNSSSSNGSNSIQATAPKTGDSNDIRVWYLLLMASLGGLGFIGYSKKKEK